MHFCKCERACIFWHIFMYHILDLVDYYNSISFHNHWIIFALFTRDKHISDARNLYGQELFSALDIRERDRSQVHVSPLFLQFLLAVRGFPVYVRALDRPIRSVMLRRQCIAKIVICIHFPNNVIDHRENDVLATKLKKKRFFILSDAQFK